MASNSAPYRAKVLNIDGYVVMFPNVAENQPKVTTPPNPYAESADPLYPLGTKLIQGERVWRYCMAGSSGLNIGAPQQQAKAADGEQDDDITIVSTAVVGATEVILKSTTSLDAAPNDVVDNFKEGYIYFNVAQGLGQCYKIKSNEALVTTGEPVFTLYDGLTIEVTSSSKCGLVQHPYRKVLATEAPLSGLCAGVPGIAVTGDYYFWIQRGGPAAVAVNTTIALGTYAVVGTTAAKADPSALVTTELPIGVMMTPGITGGGDHALIFLTLES